MEAVSLTLYVPGKSYFTTGFFEFDFAGVPPSKVHAHDVVLLLDKSVKFMLSPCVITVLSAVKFAAGGFVSFIQLPYLSSGPKVGSASLPSVVVGQLQVVGFGPSPHQ